MGLRKIVYFSLAVSLVFSSAAAQNSENVKPLPVDFRDYYSFSRIETEPWQETSAEKTTTSRAPKALLLSVAVPGLGQIYNHSYLRAGAFLAAEVGLILYGRDQRKEGRELEAVFEEYADLHWDEDTYWNAIAQESGIDLSDMTALREYERGAFSHHLPEEKNQTYYENIGKYNQFNVGWDDTNSHRATDSQNREDYTFMRKDSNDAFERARAASSLIIINHVLSAFEAAWTARKQDKKLQTSLRMEMKPYKNELVPALAFKFSW